MASCPVWWKENNPLCWTCLSSQVTGSGVDLWRQFLQRILHPRPLRPKTAGIRTGGHLDHCLLRHQQLEHYNEICHLLLHLIRLWWLDSTTELQVLAFFISGKRELMAMLAFWIRYTLQVELGLFGHSWSWWSWWQSWRDISWTYRSFWTRYNLDILHLYDLDDNLGLTC